MPKIQKIYHLEITPSQFVEACDETELFELILLANSKLDRGESENESIPQKRKFLMLKDIEP